MLEQSFPLVVFIHLGVTFLTFRSNLFQGELQGSCRLELRVKLVPMLPAMSSCCINAASEFVHVQQLSIR